MYPRSLFLVGYCLCTLFEGHTSLSFRNAKGQESVQNLYARSIRNKQRQNQSSINTLFETSGPRLQQNHTARNMAQDCNKAECPNKCNAAKPIARIKPSINTLLEIMAQDCNKAECPNKYNTAKPIARIKCPRMQHCQDQLLEKIPLRAIPAISTVTLK